ncbi:MAG: hypothetical protein CMM52_17365 [Rhodospirillaceae bacterium]|nr:hypothetical protein [Rhodospirillaceae bacterium]|tara:strand:+ start:17596 stop:18180 length:585 start_codon:yes stop_codon:yes gene_type:complete
MQREIRRQDLMPMDEYSGVRRQRAKALAAAKRNRRVELGPSCTFYFESYDTMWFQIHEMLYIEKGGEEQINGELEAYNPLIPNGRELVATVMIEVGDPGRRMALLSKIGGFEETISLMLNGETINGISEVDVDRTTSDGKASSVQFLRFPFTDEQTSAFKREGADVVLAIGHPEYRHMAGVPEQVRTALSLDLD